MHHGKVISVSPEQPNEKKDVGKSEILVAAASTCVIRDTIHLLVARNGDIVGGADAMRRDTFVELRVGW